MKFIKKGILTSYQDLGQKGLRHLGINPKGAMDRYTARILNIALGKNEEEKVLEMYFPAPEILFEEDCSIIIGGADFLPHIDNQPIMNEKVISVKAGSIIRFKRKINGNIAYLASTKSPMIFKAHLGFSIIEKEPHKLIRFIEGHEFELLENESRNWVENKPFQISSNSNRMGFRMIGEPLLLKEKKELISSAVEFGTIQLLPNGQLIILMADHQTSGGYPRIGNIISADIHKLAQSSINDYIYLKKVSIQEAEDACLEQEKNIQKLKASIRFFNEY